MGRDAVVARSRGRLCRAIARDPSEGVAPEGGARPMIADEYDKGSIRDPATQLFPESRALRVYLATGSHQIEIVVIAGAVGSGKLA